MTLKNPATLVQLSSLPEDKWEGLTVYHPMQQDADGPHWEEYDVGVVVEWGPDPDFAKYGVIRVIFRCTEYFHDGVHSLEDHGDSVLHYSSDNLWVNATYHKMR